MRSLRAVSTLLLLSAVDFVAATPAPIHEDVRSLFTLGRYGYFKRDGLGLSHASLLDVRQAGDACEDRCRKPCKYGKIRARPTCRCLCPPKTKSEGKLCIPESGDGGDCAAAGKEKGPDGKCIDKPEDNGCPLGQEKGADGKCVDEKEKKYQEKKELEKKKWQNGKKERDYQKKKEKEKEKYGERKREREDSKRRTGRMGRCVLLVSVVLGADTAEELSDNYFSADVLTSPDLEEFWDDSVPLDPAIDDKLDTDEYTNEWAEGLKLPDELETRSLPAGSDDAPKPHHKVKRFFWLLIAPITAAAARIGTAVANAGPKIASIATKGFRITKAGAQRVAKPEQLKTIRDKVVTNKNWQRCLKGEKPAK